MNLLKKAVLSTAVGLAFATAGVAAHADTYAVLGGTFFMDGVSSAVSPITASAGASLIEGTYQAYTGSFGKTTFSSGPFFNDFNFSGKPVKAYTASTGIDAVTHAAPSINWGAMTADMGAFYAWWNGVEFNQGGAATVTSLGGNNYRLAWSSLIVGGPFDGFTGNWTMDIAKPVPVPAAAWLLGSGLMGLVGVARRRKSA